MTVKDAEFCGECGAKVTHSEPEKQTRNATTFFRKRWKIVLPVAVVLLAIAIGLSIFFFRVYPGLVVARSFPNLVDEVTQRADGSPLQIYGVLVEIAEDVTITADFDYRYSLGWGLGVGASGVATISADTRNNNYAISAELSSMGVAIDLEAYINKERVAVGSQLVGGDFFGITYETFRDDVRNLGNLIGLGSREMDTMADFVEAFGEYINAPSVSFDEIFENYIELLADFIIRDLRFRLERAEITSGGESVRANRVTAVIAQSDVASFLGDVYALLENDEHMRSYFSMYNAIRREHALSYDEFLWQIRNTIRQLELHSDGDVRLEFYVGPDNRMLRTNVLIDMQMDRERIDIRASFDFGSAADDPWTLDLTWSGRYGRENISFTWGFGQTLDGFENTVEVTGGSVLGGDTSIFTTIWSPDNGRFAVSYSDSLSSNSITGTFVVEDGGGFRLKFDSMELGPRQSLIFEVTASPGAQIGDVEFINIDQWDRELINHISNLLSRLSPLGAILNR